MSMRRITVKPGDKFGRLSVVRELERRPPNKRGRRLRVILTECECGVEKVALLTNLTNKKTRSCGCLLSENRPGKRGPHIRQSTKTTRTNEASYESIGINVSHYNRHRPVEMGAGLKSFPLFDIYRAMKTSDERGQKALLDYAIDFYGESCVSRFFERCERAV